MSFGTAYQRKAHGKFLLTAEYAVLDGASALAVPLQLGQYLMVENVGLAMSQPDVLSWQSIDYQGNTWFRAEYTCADFYEISSTDAEISGRLRQMLRQLNSLSAGFLPGIEPGTSTRISTQLDFDGNWGLGSSSTLIALLADWANVNPYLLLEQTFGGSGYDLACAFAPQPLVYQRNVRDMELVHYPQVQSISYLPPPDAQTYFVYLNKKMNSRQAIENYRRSTSSDAFIARVSALTQEFIAARDLHTLSLILNEHEALLGERLCQTPVQELYFKDFPGAVKSMGAWGGDFVFVATYLNDEEMRLWCNQNGFSVFFPYHQLAL